MANYKQISKNIQRVMIDNPRTPGGEIYWINISNAGKKEIEYLRKNYKFSLSHLQASSSKATALRPTIERTDDYLFIILHFPIFQGDNIIPGEIEFFVKKGLVVTLHNNNIKSLSDFFSLCKKDGDSLLSYKFESAAVLLYEILYILVQDTYALLDQNSLNILDAEKIIYNQQSKTAVHKILALRRNIINTRRILQNHKNIIKKLIHFETGLVGAEEIKKYYIKLLEHSKRIWENLENQKEMIEVLNSTNESFMNYRISDIMKTLTIFSVIVFPLTLLAAIFGMNITNGMPLANNPNGFWIVISFMIAGCLAMLLFFAKKRWL